MVRRLLNVLRTEGVLMEEDFTNIHAGRLQMKDCYRCCLESIREYSPYDIFDMREALRQMRATGPLLAVIDISENYDNCRDSGHIYSFEPENVVVDESDEPVTHAICVVAFVIEKGTACFDCQDSQGPNWSKVGVRLVNRGLFVC
uniref:Peptidase C1A papain C-terminal domain-containing protein n=1 Tax=Leersia perrieri TaxID=77586 RepID=A0A0D9WJA8_9ORYZ